MKIYILNIKNWFLVLLVMQFSYLKAQNQFEFVVQSKHTDKIKTLMFLPDNNYFISVAENVKLWNTYSGKLIRTFSSSGSSAIDAKVSPDMKTVLISFRDTTLLLWDIKNGNILKSFPINVPMYKVYFCEDLIHIVTIGNKPDGKETKSYIWDIDTGKEVLDSNLNSSKICLFSNLRYSNRENVRMKNRVEKSGNSIIVKSTENKQVIKEIKLADDFKAKYTSLLFRSPDGNYVFFNVDFDLNKSVLVILDIEKGEEVTRINIETELKNMVFSPDEKYVAFFSFEVGIVVLDYRNGQEVSRFKLTNWITNMVFSSDSKYLLCGDHDGIMVLRDIGNEVNLVQYKSILKPVKEVVVSPDGAFLYSISDDQIVSQWKISTAEITNTIILDKKYDGSLQYLRSGNPVFDTKNETREKILKRIFFPQDTARLVITEKEVYVQSKKNIHYYNYPGLLKRVKTPEKRTKLYCTGAVSPVSNEFVVSIYSYISKTEILLFKCGIFEPVKIVPVHEEVTSMCYSPDGKVLAVGFTNGSICLFKTEDFTIIKQIENKSYGWGSIASLNYSHSGKYIVCCTKGNTINIWDAISYTKYKTYNYHSDAVNSVLFSPDDRYIVSASSDNTARVCNIETDNWVAFITDKNGQWLTYTNDGYWDSSGNGGEMVSISNGLNSMAIDRFAVFSNRPDILISRLWDTGSNCTSSFEKYYKKRIRKFSLEKNIKQQIILPESEIVELVQNGKNVNLKASFNAFEKELKSFNIYINNVPYFGSLGKELTGKISTITQNFELNSGANKIEISCTDKDGIESFRITRMVYSPAYFLGCWDYHEKTIDKEGHLYLGIGHIIESINGKTFSTDDQLKNYTSQLWMTEKDMTYWKDSKLITKKFKKGESIGFNFLMPVNKGNLYFVGFGVSKYDHDDFNLRYASKDVIDLSETFRNMQGDQFEKVYIKTFVNKEVNIKNINSIKNFIKDSKPDDTFILFVAGHGMHDFMDTKLQYYFLTSLTDTADLKSTAAPFELFENILQGIAPRNKLFLIDACESGELDLDEILEQNSMADKGNMTSRGFKTLAGTTVQKTGGVLTCKLNKKYGRYIYNDLSRRSGAIVFSSSCGGELSYERSDIENGLFTEYIMKALTTPEADKDGNGFVSTDELRQYVSEQVAKTSGDLQHPSVDRDNIYQKFGFQIK